MNDESSDEKIKIGNKSIHFKIRNSFGDGKIIVCLIV